MLKIIISILVLAMPLVASATGIKVNVTDAVNDTVLFGQYWGSTKNMLVIDTVLLKNGAAEIKNDTLPSGMYFLFTGKKKYDLLLERDDNVSITFSSHDYFPKVGIKGSPVCHAFVNYMKYLEAVHDLIRQDSTQVQKTAMTVNSYVVQEIISNKGNIFGKFLRFMQPIVIPDSMTGNASFYYYKNHFFDNANIFDRDMLHTPLIEDKLNEYYSLLVESPDSICKDIDALLQRAAADKDVFRFVLVQTLQHYLQSKQIIAENVWVHVADKWYISHASWSDLGYIERLKYQVKMRKPNLIGRSASDFEMTVISQEEMLKAKSDTAVLNNVYQGFDTKFSALRNSGYTLLVFFEADCSHCKEQMPKFWDVYNKFKASGLRTIAIHNNNTKEGKVMWCNYVNEHQYYDSNWINAWSPYANKYRELYNIESTPTVYLIHNGKIELKNIDAKTLEEYLSARHRVLQH